MRSAGFRGDIVHAPPPVGVEFANFDLPGCRRAPPPRPPRILYVGSETIANLDGLRWFRRQVFPQILQSVADLSSAGCRGSGATYRARAVDRSGRSDRLRRERVQRRGRGRFCLCAWGAACAAAPSRPSRRARRWSRRPSALTALPSGPCRMPLSPTILASWPSETIRILSSDDLRVAYERNAAEVARRDLNSPQAMASFCRSLGLPIDARAGSRARDGLTTTGRPLLAEVEAAASRFLL